MERHRGNLEADAGDHQDHREHQPRILLQPVEHHLTQVRRPGQAIHQRHAVQQDAERERTEQEILDRRFVRSLIRLDEPGQNVERHRHRLEADEDGNQIDSAGHDHHAERGAQNEEVVLAWARAFDLQVPDRHQHGDQRSDEKDTFEEQRETIDRNEMRHLLMGAREWQERGERRSDHDHRHPGERLAAARQGHIDDEYEQRAGGEHQLRQDVPEVVDRHARRHYRGSPGGMSAPVPLDPVSGLP